MQFKTEQFLEYSSYQNRFVLKQAYRNMVITFKKIKIMKETFNSSLKITTVSENGSSANLWLFYIGYLSNDCEVLLEEQGISNCSQVLCGCIELLCLTSWATGFVWSLDQNS